MNNSDGHVSDNGSVSSFEVLEAWDAGSAAWSSSSASEGNPVVSTKSNIEMEIVRELEEPESESKFIQQTLDDLWNKKLEEPKLVNDDPDLWKINPKYIFRNSMTTYLVVQPPQDGLCAMYYITDMNMQESAIGSIKEWEETNDKITFNTGNKNSGHTYTFDFVKAKYVDLKQKDGAWFDPILLTRIVGSEESTLRMKFLKNDINRKGIHDHYKFIAELMKFTDVPTLVFFNGGIDRFSMKYEPIWEIFRETEGLTFVKADRESDLAKKLNINKFPCFYYFPEGTKNDNRKLAQIEPNFNSFQEFLASIGKVNLEDLPTTEGVPATPGQIYPPYPLPPFMLNVPKGRMNYYIFRIDDDYKLFLLPHSPFGVQQKEPTQKEKDIFYTFYNPEIYDCEFIELGLLQYDIATVREVNKYGFIEMEGTSVEELREKCLQLNEIYDYFKFNNKPDFTYKDKNTGQKGYNPFDLPVKGLEKPVPTHKGTEPQIPFPLSVQENARPWTATFGPLQPGAVPASSVDPTRMVVQYNGKPTDKLIKPFKGGVAVNDNVTVIHEVPSHDLRGMKRQSKQLTSMVLQEPVGGVPEALDETYNLAPYGPAGFEPMELSGSGTFAPSNFAPVTDGTKYTVFFNRQFNTAVLLNDMHDIELKPGFMDQVKKILPEMLEVKKINLDETAVPVIKEYFLHNIFDNVKELEQYLARFQGTGKKRTKVDSDEIKQFLQKNFKLSNDIKERIKFTDMLDAVMKGMNVEDNYRSTVKRRLPFIMKELGLQKKRYSEGMYWYGLTKITGVQTTFSQTPVAPFTYTPLAPFPYSPADLPGVDPSQRSITEFMEKVPPVGKQVSVKEEGKQKIPEFGELRSAPSVGESESAHAFAFNSDVPEVLSMTHDKEE